MEPEVITIDPKKVAWQIFQSYEKIIEGLEYIENPRAMLHMIIDQLIDAGGKVITQRERPQ